MYSYILNTVYSTYAFAARVLQLASPSQMGCSLFPSVLVAIVRMLVKHADSDDEDPLSTDNEEEHDEEGNDEDDDGEPLTSDDDFSWDAVDFDNIPNADQKLVKAAAFMICKAHKMI